MLHSDRPGGSLPGSSLRTLAALAVCCAMFLGRAPDAAAQNTATISGIVSDATGAVIPGAQVTSTCGETGAVATVSTNEVGSYTIAVKSPGSKSFRSSGLVLNVRGRAVIDVALELGEVTETIEVTDTAVQLQTEKATVEEVVPASRSRTSP